MDMGCTLPWGVWIGAMGLGAVPPGMDGAPHASCSSSTLSRSTQLGRAAELLFLWYPNSPCRTAPQYVRDILCVFFRGPSKMVVLFLLSGKNTPKNGVRNAPQFSSTPFPPGRKCGAGAIPWLKSALAFDWTSFLCHKRSTASTVA